MKLRLAYYYVAAALAGAMPAHAQTPATATAERGHALAIMADCQPCHTNAEQPPFSGGRSIETPFGVIMSANITPDPQTGIGAWSEDEVISAIQNGKGQGGKRLYPAMPYPYFTKMSRDDARAIYAYLKTIPPVRKAPPRNKLPFPFNVRILMVGWNTLFFKPGPLRGDAQKSAAWNRGAYLVEGPGHCGACHTPKNILGADKKSESFSGDMLQYWHTDDLRGDAVTGLGHWTADDLTQFLKTGHNRFAAAGASMAEVVTNSTSQMTDSDLRAIVTYLKDLPAQNVTPPRPLDPNAPTMRSGKAIYVDSCNACHGSAGDGVPELFPMLKDDPSVRAGDATSLIRIVLEGTQTAATAANPSATAMPAFGWKLNDEQIAAVLNYVRNSWQNAAAPVTAKAVEKLRRKLPRPQ